MAIVALLQKVYPRLLLFPASGRVGGLLDNPIYMGAYQIFNLAFLTLLFFKTPSKMARWFYAALAVVDMAAFMAAQSRGALIGLAVGLIMFAAFYGIFTKNHRARYGILGFIALLFVTYGMLFAFRDSSFVRNSGFARLTNFSGSVSTRFIAWNIAWKGFKERPLTGWGFDNFHLLFNYKYNPQSLRFGVYETWFDRAHNTILDVLSMTGIFGLVTFLMIFVAMFTSIWRAFRRQWIDLPIAAILFALPVAYFVQNLFVFDHPALFSMSFLLYGIVIAATRGEFVGQGEVTAPVDSEKQKRGFSWFAYGLLQCLALLLVWRTSLLPFEASRLAIAANNAFGTTYGFSQAQAAANIWTPYVDEQSFLLSRNLIQTASQGNLTKLPNWQDQYRLVKRINEEEIRRHGHNTHPHLIYAQLAAVVASYLPSEAAVAEREYLAGIETSPKRQQLYYGLGNLYLRMGRKAEML
ncbi:MAG: O-antigen ligase family protein, partial [Candidatus Uhrbacteria bacterium]|nr:O-antigen ligase family protein [Candidatus Uhrbacteria bacterium]